MTERDCRICGIRLTPENARRYQGRWIGACRGCESALTIERQYGRPVVRPRALCDGCGLVRSVNSDGRLIRHGDGEARCPGSGTKAMPA